MKSENHQRTVEVTIHGLHLKIGRIPQKKIILPKNRIWLSTFFTFWGFQPFKTWAIFKTPDGFEGRSCGKTSSHRSGDGDKSDAGWCCVVRSSKNICIKCIQMFSFLVVWVLGGNFSSACLMAKASNWIATSWKAEGTELPPLQARFGGHFFYYKNALLECVFL